MDAFDMLDLFYANKHLYEKVRSAKMAMEKEEYIDLTETRAMIYIPENSVEITLIAKVFENGTITECKKKLDMKDCREAIEDAEKNYIEDDDLYAITDKGRAYLGQLKEGKTNLVD